ncbi:MAG: GNAT family N-acetyltransferase [Verrucomicrobiota bacterium]
MIPLEHCIQRFITYSKRHGFLGTLRRLELSYTRIKDGQNFILFSCDLKNFTPVHVNGLAHVSVERKKDVAELGSQDLFQILHIWNPVIARRQLVERFQRGASLWILKLEGDLVAYGWTLVGKTIEPYFFSLNSNEVHLFDFFVFPAFRGRKINLALMNHILAALASEQKSRALIEAAEWNSAQLSSLKNSQFQQVGRARKGTVFRKAKVKWN